MAVAIIFLLLFFLVFVLLTTVSPVPFTMPRIYFMFSKHLLNECTLWLLKSLSGKIIRFQKV